MQKILSTDIHSPPRKKQKREASKATDFLLMKSVTFYFLLQDYRVWAQRVLAQKPNAHCLLITKLFLCMDIGLPLICIMLIYLSKLSCVKKRYIQLDLRWYRTCYRRFQALPCCFCYQKCRYALPKVWGRAWCGGNGIWSSHTLRSQEVTHMSLYSRALDRLYIF